MAAPTGRAEHEDAVRNLLRLFTKPKVPMHVAVLLAGRCNLRGHRRQLLTPLAAALCIFIPLDTSHRFPAD
jgi:hypothetical protein